MTTTDVIFNTMLLVAGVVILILIAAKTGIWWVNRKGPIEKAVKQDLENDQDLRELAVALVESRETHQVYPIEKKDYRYEVTLPGGAKIYTKIQPTYSMSGYYISINEAHFYPLSYLEYYIQYMTLDRGDTITVIDRKPLPTQTTDGT